MSGRDEIKAVHRSLGLALPGWLKYDPGQARDKGGRWTRGGASGGGITTAETAMQSMEEKIVSQDYESLLAVDADGNELLRKDGGKSEIGFTDQEMEKMRGGICTHNHPSGGSFSPEDIQFTTDVGTTEMRAVGIQDGVRYRYTWKPNRPIEGKELKMFQRIINLEDSKLRKEMWGRINDGYITPDAASDIHYHMLWSRVSGQMKSYGINTGYKREEW